MPRSFDLPPTRVAKALPVTLGARAISKDKNKSKPKQKNTRANSRRSNDNDQGPRAFRRIMEFASGKRVPNGLDEGKQPKRQVPSKDLSILPGEDMAAFSARVNAAIPLTTADTRTIRASNDPLGLKPWRTRKEMKMHKLYDQWREEDRKLKEREEEALEEQAERELESDIFLTISDPTNPDNQTGSGGKQKKRSREEDPWEEVKRRRAEAKPRLHGDAPVPAASQLDMTKIKRIGGRI